MWHRLHVSSIPPDEVTSVSGIPVTTAPRTLLDLAAVLGGREIELAMEEMEVKRYTDRLSLPLLLDRYSRRRGGPKLRAILARGRIGTTLTRSELEERFLRFIADHGLPAPEMKVPIAVRSGFFEADCVWRRKK